MPMSFQQQIIEEFRANAGKVGGPFEGSDLLLLTTTGARSGAEHTVPLGCVPHGEVPLVVASAAGADHHPAWYHNLLKHPLVRVELGDEVFTAIAVPAEGERRDRLFAHVVRAVPGYASYQAKTNRTLPVVALERDELEQGEGPAEVRNLADKLLEVHAWLRAQLRQVRVEADAYFTGRAAHQGGGAPPGPGLGLQLRQHCLAFCDALEFHHTSEDAHSFPALATQHPHLRDALEQLRAEHRTIARLQGELVALLTGLGTAVPGVFHAELDRLSTALGAHLDYEEESLLPALAEVPWPPADPA